MQYKCCQTLPFITPLPACTNSSRRYKFWHKVDKLYLSLATLIHSRHIGVAAESNRLEGNLIHVGEALWKINKK